MDLADQLIEAASKKPVLRAEVSRDGKTWFPMDLGRKRSVKAAAESVSWSACNSLVNWHFKGESNPYSRGNDLHRAYEGLGIGDGSDVIEVRWRVLSDGEVVAEGIRGLKRGEKSCWGKTYRAG